MTSTEPSKTEPPHPLRARLWIVALVLLLAGLVAIPAGSLTRALTAPGAATWQVRTVDWIRDHGGAPAVNTIENWYYSRHAPADGPPNPWTLPAAAAHPGPQRPGAGPAPLPLLPGRAALPDEGRWWPGRLGATGTPLIFTSYFRPDPAHASVVAGAAWIRRPGTAAHLVAGTTQPGGQGWPGNAAVPVTDRPNLIATFNSGWRMNDINGGFSIAGRSRPPLVNGQATAAVDTSGRLTVGEWGRDLTPSSPLVAARQNLALIVDRGQPIAGLVANSHGQWGSPKNQFQYTSRSGLGVERNGNTVYVAGENLTLDTLATALADAGAVRGMELDIHHGLTFFASWLPQSGQSSPSPTKLLPTMTRSADRYLTPDQRDFFYVTAAPTPLSLP